MTEPADERMPPIKLKAVREWVGVSGDWLASFLGVSARTIRSWEDGRNPIPGGVRLEVEALEALTGQAVTAAVASARDARDPVIVTYRHDGDYWEAEPGAVARLGRDGAPVRWPASWHRRVAMRVAMEVPGLAIVEYTREDQ